MKLPKIDQGVRATEHNHYYFNHKNFPLLDLQIAPAAAQSSWLPTQGSYFNPSYSEYLDNFQVNNFDQLQITLAADGPGRWPALVGTIGAGTLCANNVTDFIACAITNDFSLCAAGLTKMILSCGTSVVVGVLAGVQWWRAYHPTVQSDLENQNSN
jgi:hypothetical protein